MITEMIIAVVSWPALVILLLVFGFAPGAVLRLLVRAFHRDDPRRQEMLAEIHAVPRLERPFWVAEQLEVAISEGIWGRIVWAATGRIIYRWRLGSGVESNRRAPETFYIPPDCDKDILEPGDTVKLMFQMKDGWGERMWVKITAIEKGRFLGTLRNEPIGIPRLDFDSRVKFRREHIIDIIWMDDDQVDDQAAA